ncbi:MAG: sel1 repeat family protein [Betaproteobacteria bacterium]|nr:sel1 repeat family protein [Betaproteobacteria bacterium]
MLPLMSFGQDPTEPESLYRIARFLLVPDSNSDEITRGLRYLKRSADGGYEPAARDYARRLESGTDIPKDETAARRYYQVAAQQGDPVSPLSLARMCQDGRGGDQDEQAAFRLRSETAATGDPNA